MKKINEEEVVAVLFLGKKMKNHYSNLSKDKKDKVKEYK